MRRDPHVRSYAQPAPYVPGTTKRFRWPEPHDEDVRKVREGVQEDGRGLFVLRMPYDGEKALVEAYYPEDIRPHYANRNLDPFRRDDFGMGRLVVVGVLNDIKPPNEPVNGNHIDELRRNNRNARRDLRRQSNASYRALEIHDQREQEEQEVFDRWEDFYKSAIRDTVEYGMKSRIGPHHSVQLGAA